MSGNKKNIEYFREIIKDKEEYNFLNSLVKYYKRGSKENFTYLFIKNNEVIKYFHRTMDKERRYWCHRFMIKDELKLTCSCGLPINKLIEKEIHYMKKLEKFKYFSKLIKFSYKSQYIIMDNCGDTVRYLPVKKIILLPKNYMEQIRQICNIFIKENIYHNDLNLTNICLKDNIIKVIDYGCIQRLNILKECDNFKKYKTNYEQLSILFKEFIEINIKKIKFV